MLPGIACLALAVVIFIVAEGNRRFYSGIFFVLLGMFLITNARRGGTGNKSSE
jgi:hypothetical protein